MRSVVCLLLAASVAACVTTETVSFKPKAHQQGLVRDGQAALVSRLKTSIVLVRPASRQFQPGARPVYVLGIYNMSPGPLEFRVADVQAMQIVNQEAVALKVITYEQLVQEEQTRQVFAAMAVGLAAAGNSMSAANAGRYNSTSTVYGPRGTYNVHTTGYSPAAAAVARANASAQNEAMISAAIDRGQANMASLEAGVIKDNTLLPGEWYGGQLHLQPLVAEAGRAKTYQIVVVVGADRHEIDIAQGSP
jgi:hypothetical protein